MKKFNKKLTAVLGLTFAAVLSGCTNGQVESKENPVEAYNGEAVTINFYHTMSATNLQPALNAAIEEFNKLYPNITVKHESIGSYNDVRDQIKTEISVGAQPNLAYCYPDHVALYNQAKAVRTLDDFINSDIEQVDALGNKTKLGLTDEQKADYIDGYYSEGQSFGDGKMYTLPFSKSTEVLYYNKTFFTENNLTVPTTWEELETVSRQVKAIEPASVPLGYDSEGNWFITMAQQYGNDYTAAVEKIEDRFTFNNAGNKELIKEISEWYKDGLVTTQTLYGSYTSGLFTNLTPNDEGKVVRAVMCIGSSAGATHQRPTKGEDGNYPFEVGIAPLPQKDKAKPAAISQGPSVVMFKSTPQQEAASWLLLEFLTTDIAFQAEFSMASGYMPVLESVQNHPEYKAWLDSANGGDNVAALSAKAAFEQKNAYFTSPAFVGSSAARDEVGNLIVAAMTAAAKNELTDAKLNQIFEDAVDECIYNTK